MAIQRGAPRGGAFDALCFAAVLLMVVFDYGLDAPVRLEGVAGFFSRGHLATNFFLILCGFVIARAHGHELDTATFLRQRIMRVWPAHLIVLGVFAVVYLGASFAGVEPRHPENYTVHAF